MHNFCDTCTTSVKRAQLLGNKHSTISLKRAHTEYLNRLGGVGETRYTHMDIWIYIYKCGYGYMDTCIYIYVYVWLCESQILPLIRLVNHGVPS